MKQTGKKRVVFSTIIADSEQVKIIMTEARLTGRIAKKKYCLSDVNRIFKHQQVNFQTSLKLLSLVRRYFVTSHHSLHNNAIFSVSMVHNVQKVCKRCVEVTNMT